MSERHPYTGDGVYIRRWLARSGVHKRRVTIAVGNRVHQPADVTSPDKRLSDLLVLEGDWIRLGSLSPGLADFMRQSEDMVSPTGMAEVGA